MAEAARSKMNLDEFVEFEAGQDGRWELWNGVPIQMQADTNKHGIAKTELIIQLGTQLTDGPCVPISDSQSVAVSETNSFKPDATIDCGDIDPDSVYADKPTVVFEVTSKSTRTNDYVEKRQAYSKVPTIAAIVIIDLQAPRAELSIPHADRKGGFNTNTFEPTDVIEIQLQGGVVRVELEPIFRRAGVWPPVENSAPEEG